MVQDRLQPKKKAVSNKIHSILASCSSLFVKRLGEETKLKIKVLSCIRFNCERKGDDQNLCDR